MRSEWEERERRSGGGGEEKALNSGGPGGKRAKSARGSRDVPGVKEGRRMTPATGRITE